VSLAPAASDSFAPEAVSDMQGTRRSRLFLLAPLVVVAGGSLG